MPYKNNPKPEEIRSLLADFLNRRGQKVPASFAPDKNREHIGLVLDALGADTQKVERFVYTLNLALLLQGKEIQGQAGDFNRLQADIRTLANTVFHVLQADRAKREEIMHSSLRQESSMYDLLKICSLNRQQVLCPNRDQQKHDAILAEKMSAPKEKR